MNSKKVSNALAMIRRHLATIETELAKDGRIKTYQEDPAKEKILQMTMTEFFERNLRGQKLWSYLFTSHGPQEGPYKKYGDMPVGEFVTSGLSRRELLNLGGVGKKMLKRVSEKLAEFGITWELEP